MSATSGRTSQTIPTAGRSFTTRAVPRVELPANTSELAQRAAAELGWHGTVLPETTILGRKVCVVARMRTDVHAERLALGLGPMADRITVSTWTWPEFVAEAPSPAAEIIGVLVMSRHWRTAMASAVPFARYGDAALVLPSSVALSHDYVEKCLPRARAYGMAIVTADSGPAVHETHPDELDETFASVQLDLAGSSQRLIFAEDAVSRWMNEVVYEQLLASYSLPVA